MSYNSNTARSSDVRVKANKGKGNKKEEELAELRKPLDYLFEKELINKQNKYIHIMDTFSPSRNTYNLSTKFYARHEQHKPPNSAVFLPFVYGSSYKHNTEANVYGWMPQKVNRTSLLKELNFVSAPKLRCCLTVYGEKLECEKANAKPAFNGIRFFLQ